MQDVYKLDTRPCWLTTDQCNPCERHENKELSERFLQLHSPPDKWHTSELFHVVFVTCHLLVEALAWDTVPLLRPSYPLLPIVLAWLDQIGLHNPTRHHNRCLLGLCPGAPIVRLPRISVVHRDAAFDDSIVAPTVQKLDFCWPLVIPSSSFEQCEHVDRVWR